MTTHSVLLVDPEDARRQRRHGELSRCGWNVQCATSATTGLAIVNWFHPDVVLFDAHAGGIELAQFATLVRSDPANDELLLIVTADEIDDALEARARRAEFDGVVCASDELSSVLTTIRRLRDARGAARDA